MPVMRGSPGKIAASMYGDGLFVSLFVTPYGKDDCIGTRTEPTVIARQHTSSKTKNILNSGWRRFYSLYL